MSEYSDRSFAGVRALVDALRRAMRSQRGMTVLELLISIGVISILAAMMMPWARCQVAKAKYASIIEDMRHARAAIEAFEADLGSWPCSLQEAFGDKPVPRSLAYCSDDYDFNSGHGNEFCSFFDTDNPSGSNNHSGSPGIGYVVWTTADISACTGVKFVWNTCCGEEPTFCYSSEEAAKKGGGRKDTDPDCQLPAHPGNPQGAEHDKGVCTVNS
jgi:prepilin-type N-terminal cleavage/methylation domain-containing protein